MCRKCDRCGTVFDPKEFDFDHLQKYKDGRPIEYISIGVRGMERSYDLCDDCENQFRDWMGRDITNLH